MQAEDVALPPVPSAPERASAGPADPAGQAPPPRRASRPGRAVAALLVVLAAVVVALALTGGLRTVRTDLRSEAGRAVDVGPVAITPTGYVARPAMERATGIEPA